MTQESKRSFWALTREEAMRKLLALLILLAGCTTTGWRGAAIGATTLDAASTVIAVNCGASEQNPVLGQNPTQIVAIQAAILGVVWYISKDLKPEQQKTVWKWATALHLGAAAWNLSQEK